MGEITGSCRATSFKSTNNICSTMASKILSRLASNIPKLSTRNYASGAELEAYEKARSLWKNVFFFVALPAVGICYVNTHLTEADHHKHWVRPEFREYDHLRTRTKAFPWGDGNHSLFHNPAINALPEGYEDEL